MICVLCFCDTAFAMEAGSTTGTNDGATKASKMQEENQDTIGKTQEQEKESEIQDAASNQTSPETTKESGTQDDAQNNDAKAAAPDPAQSQSLRAVSGDGVLRTDMPEGELLFITLAQDTSYRWNANDSAEKKQRDPSGHC